MTMIFVAFIMLSTGQAMIGPAIEFIKTGDLITFLAIKLPFIDEESVWGFHLNLGIQTLIKLFGTVGNLSIEMTSCIINNTISLCSEIILFNCKQVSIKVESLGHITFATKAELREIFIQVQDLDRYILDMSDLYYWRMFSAPILITYSVSISVFCQYSVSLIVRTIAKVFFNFKISNILALFTA